MGFPCFSKFLKYVFVALIGSTAAVVSILFLSSSVAAQDAPDGGNDRPSLRAWDTDNLRFSGYSARNFHVPYHNYGGYVGRVEAKPCIQYTAIGSVLRPSDYGGVCLSGFQVLTKACVYSYHRYVDSSSSQSVVGYAKPTVDGRIGYSCGTLSKNDAANCGTFGCFRVTRSVDSIMREVSGLKLCGSYPAYSLGTNCGADTVYRTRALHAGCQSGIADAFFQTGGTATGGEAIVDEFPVLEYEDSWKLKTGSGRRDSGCVDFASDQDRLAGGTSGYYLKTQNTASGEAVLVAATGSEVLPTRVTARPVAVYGSWVSKGTGYGLFGINTNGSYSFHGAYSPSGTGYADRVDTRTALAMASGLPAGLLFPWEDPNAAGLGGGQGSVSCTAGTRDACVRYLAQFYYGVWNLNFQSGNMSAGSLFVVARRNEAQHVVAEFFGQDSHLSAGQDSGGLWCPVGMHPRGQGAAAVIGSSTGRTLSSLSTAASARVADSYWCRSDVRYKQGLKAQDHSGYAPANSTVADDGVFFQAYGRKNCYRTVIELKVDPVTKTAECVYRYPLPLCDPDPDNGSDSDWREFTAAEVANIGVVDEPLLVDEGAYCGTNINPPDLAGFDADACVEVTVAVYENRKAGSNAEPGVPADDRTVAVGGDVAVYDLDITAPHTKTASPPRDETAGSVDPSGCADGEEARSDHGSRANPTDAVLPAASAERKSSGAATNPANPQTVPYPLPSSSAASNTAAPPSDYDADNSYAGVRANLAHRYASQIAENTCSVKQAEADMVLAVLEAREASFTQWLANYKTAADLNKILFRDYAPNNRNSAGLSAYWAADTAAERQRTADALEVAYGELSTALTAAKTKYDSTTDDSTAAVSVLRGSSGCVSHYDNEIDRLKTLFKNAESTALGGGANGISEETTKVRVTTAMPWDRPDVTSTSSKSGVTSHTRTPSGPVEVCETDEDGDETCEDVTTYTCSGFVYTVSGRTTGTYTQKSRALVEGVLRVSDGTAHRVVRDYSITYTALAGSYKSSDDEDDQHCPEATASGTDKLTNEGNVRGSEGTFNAWPTPLHGPAEMTEIYSRQQRFALGSSLLLGKYDTSHTARAELADLDQLKRATAATSLGTLSAGSSDAANSPASYALIAVPTNHNTLAAEETRLRTAITTEATEYRDAYVAAYDRAYRLARADMGGTGSRQEAVWANFHWEYDTDSLKWAGYTQNTTTDTTLADGTVIAGQAGCDLVSVASDGTVTVQATRLDYETSHFGVGTAFAARADGDRECKIRRTRTPRLVLRYEPPTATTTQPWRACPAVMVDATRPCGTDSIASKTGSYYNTAFTPATAGAEKFKLYPRKPSTEPGEAEIFNIKVDLANSPPVLCHTTYNSNSRGGLPRNVLYVSNKAAAGANTLLRTAHGWSTRPASETQIARPTGSTQTLTDGHCFAKPPSGRGWAIFDDTAHSDITNAYAG